MAELNVNPQGLPNVGLEVTAQPLNVVAQPAVNRAGSGAGGYLLEGLAKGLDAFTKGFDQYAAAKTETFAKSEQELALVNSIKENAGIPTLDASESMWYKETAAQLANAKLTADQMTGMQAGIQAKLEDQNFLLSGNWAEYEAELYKGVAQVEDPKLAAMFYPRAQALMAEGRKAFDKASKQAHAQDILVRTTAAVNSKMVQASTLPDTHEGYAQLQALMAEAKDSAVSALGPDKGMKLLVQQAEYGIKTLGVIGISDALRDGNYGALPGAAGVTDALNATVVYGETFKKQLQSEQQAKAEADWKDSLRNKFDSMSANIMQGIEPTNDEWDLAKREGRYAEFLGKVAANRVDKSVEVEALSTVATLGYDNMRAGGGEQAAAQQGFDLMIRPKLAAASQSTEPAQFAGQVASILHTHRAGNSGANLDAIAFQMSGASLEPMPAKGGSVSDRFKKSFKVYESAVDDPNLAAYAAEGSKLFNKADLETLQSTHYLYKNAGLTVEEALSRTLEMQTAQGLKARKEQIGRIRPQLDAEVKGMLTSYVNPDTAPAEIARIQGDVFQWASTMLPGVADAGQIVREYEKRVLSTQYVPVRMSNRGFALTPEKYDGTVVGNILSFVKEGAGPYLDVAGAAIGYGTEDLVHVRQPSQAVASKLPGYSRDSFGNAVAFNATLYATQNNTELVGIESPQPNVYRLRFSNDLVTDVDASSIWTNYEKFASKTGLAGQNFKLIKKGQRDEALKAVRAQLEADTANIRKAGDSAAAPLKPQDILFQDKVSAAQTKAASSANLPVPYSVPIPGDKPDFKRYKTTRGPVPNVPDFNVSKQGTVIPPIPDSLKATLPQFVPPPKVPPIR